MFLDKTAACCVLCIQQIHLECVFQFYLKLMLGCYLLFLSHHSIDTILHIHGQFLIHKVYVVCLFYSYGYQYCILKADFVGNGVIYYFCTYNKSLIPVILGYLLLLALYMHYIC